MTLIKIFYILSSLIYFVDSHTIGKKDVITEPTRRIIGGRSASDTRPYMVYLRRDPVIEKGVDNNWLCGGAIVHVRHIVTSAACIEDVKNFYVVSGTHNWITNDKENECIKNGAKKAVWKCVPKSYVYDGDEFDNISWMQNDIAVVKVEDDFNFDRKIKGCDYAPGLIAYNSDDVGLEKKGTVGSTAGWGSIDTFSNPLVTDAAQRSAKNSPDLLETEVVVLSKKNCKRMWEPRYHQIIDESMICAKDSASTDDSICADRGVNCKELVYSDEDIDDEEQGTRRMMPDTKDMQVHSAAHFNDTRRSKAFYGGFCENDHGGPLVMGRGKTSILVGIISACLTREVTRKCYGPFLYTSVYKNRNLISCAIYKEISENKCKVLLRSSNTQMKETLFDWGKEKKNSNTNENAPLSTRSFQDMMERFKHKSRIKHQRK